jgi:hypothetical protein
VRLQLVPALRRVVRPGRDVARDVARRGGEGEPVRSEEGHGVMATAAGTARIRRAAA